MLGVLTDTVVQTRGGTGELLTTYGVVLAEERPGTGYFLARIPHFGFGREVAGSKMFLEVRPARTNGVAIKPSTWRLPVPVIRE